LSGSSAERKLGYLVPEFPGQTHIFFWREAAELRKLGLDLKVVSTRPPDPRLQSHDWCEQAKKQTMYLYPPPARFLAGSFVELLRAGPPAWGRLLRAVYASSAGRTLRNGALMVIGAQLARRARRDGWEHLHVHSCADAAMVAHLAHQITGLPYSLTLHGPLSDYGPQQPQKWRDAAFGIVITQRLLK